MSIVLPNDSRSIMSVAMYSKFPIKCAFICFNDVINGWFAKRCVLIRGTFINSSQAFTRGISDIMDELCKSSTRIRS